MSAPEQTSRHGNCDCEQCEELRRMNTPEGNDFLDALAEMEPRLPAQPKEPTMSAPVSRREFRCKDAPEALDREPRKGDQRYTLTFPLEDGTSLKVHMGRESMNHFETFIAQMMIDDAEVEERKHGG